MDRSPERNPKLTFEEIKELDSVELLEWFQREHPKALQGDKLDKFGEADIDGATFLKHAGDMEFFCNGCNLPIGTSARLADLASEMALTADPKTRKRKSPPHTNIAPLPKRTKVGDSSLTINGNLKYFRSGPVTFSILLQKPGQAYFDRTRYIFKLHDLDNSILFCRPRRFGKSLTVSMLEHFHGLQFAGEHQSLYKDLDVQNDIDQGKVKPGQYFVLTFDFSKINASTDLTEANKTLTKFLNSSIETFFETYTAYLGGNFTDLCQKIDSNEPNISLQRCVQSVQNAIKQDERLAGIEGIYVLVDEYDAFPNNYLEPPKTVGGQVAWEDTAVGRTFKSFWSTLKSLSEEGKVLRIFITGISPLSLSNLGSGFNVRRNLSFDRDLAELCGLTHLDLEDALKGICKGPESFNDSLSEMTKFFNGYHFCNDESVETVYNTETCLAYLQRLVEGKSPEAQNPENSEVSEQFLRTFTASAPAIRDLENALKCNEQGDFTSLEYHRFRPEFTLQDLSRAGSHSSWRSLLVYFGGLTFHPDKPKTHLKITNKVAADRIGLAVLERYNLHDSLEEALQYLVTEGELEQMLACYRQLMIQRDVTFQDLTETCEADHRDCFYFCLLRNHYLVPRAEFKVIKPNRTPGQIDLLLQLPGRLIVTEWKCYRISFLQVGENRNSIFTKADTLRDYKLPDILDLKFGNWDKYHQGTIGSWVRDKDGPQLSDYVKSSYVQELVKNQRLELQAHLVIIVGSRHILLWDMDKEGKLTVEPRLVEAPDRWNRQGDQDFYS